MAAQAAPSPSVNLIARAARAYQNLEFDVAAGFLRRALAPPAGDSLPWAERARALTYLAATERFRNRADSALAVFRRLVLLDPRYRPDPLIFPPEVTALFEEVRRETKVVAVALAADTELALNGGRLVAWLHASSPHDVRVSVDAEDGRLVRPLYAGPIGDSLEVRWDGRDSTDRPMSRARVWLAVASQAGGRVQRVVRVPLELELVQADTQPHPPPIPAGQLAPERTTRGAGTRALAGGLLLGAVAIALPAATAPDSRPSGGRFAVAGVLGLGGLVGFLTQRPGRGGGEGRPIPVNIEANRARREEWQRRLDAVARSNAVRLRAARLHVHAGPPERIERDAGGATP